VRIYIISHYIFNIISMQWPTENPLQEVRLVRWGKNKSSIRI